MAKTPKVKTGVIRSKALLKEKEKIKKEEEKKKRIDILKNVIKDKVNKLKK